MYLRAKVYQYHQILFWPLNVPKVGICAMIDPFGLIYDDSTGMELDPSWSEGDPPPPSRKFSGFAHVK